MSTTRWHKNDQKFYQAYLKEDMLGYVTVQCTWGSLHTRLGNHQNHVFDSQIEAIRFIDALNKKRIQRGYLKVN